MDILKAENIWGRGCLYVKRIENLLKLYRAKVENATESKVQK